MKIIKNLSIFPCFFLFLCFPIQNLCFFLAFYKSKSKVLMNFFIVERGCSFVAKINHYFIF